MCTRRTPLRAAMTVALLVAVAAAAWAQASAVPPSLPEFGLPILITPCGQSPGGVFVKVVCRTLKYDCDLVETAEVSTLAEKPYKTLIVITGTSLKGMGSAGVNLDQEIKRCEAIVKRAKQSGLRVIVAQIEGASRRTDESDERSIRSMSPLADLLLTHNEANKDGYFNKVAADNKIPQIFITKQNDLVKVFPEIFTK